MFATYLLQLPVDGGFCGGILQVQSPCGHIESHMTTAAATSVHCYEVLFLADCLHQLTPLTAGHRLVLAFSVSRNIITRNKLLVNVEEWYHLGHSSTVKASIDMLAKHLRTLQEQQLSSNHYQAALFPLRHLYTLASCLSQEALKSKDAVVTHAVLEACKLLGESAHIAVELCLMHPTRSGRVVRSIPLLFASSGSREISSAENFTFIDRDHDSPLPTTESDSADESTYQTILVTVVTHNRERSRTFLRALHDSSSTASNIDCIDCQYVQCGLLVSFRGS